MDKNDVGMKLNQKMNHRDALKCMGAAVLTGAMVSTGGLSMAACRAKSPKRVILFFTGKVHTWIGWVAKVQFLPALLAMNVGVLLILLLLTLLVGRVYCSVGRPLGVFQDLVSWLKGRREMNRFFYAHEKKHLRYGILALFVIAFVAGIGSFVALLDPYSSYRRIVTNLFAPLYRWGNNFLALLAQQVDSYTFYETDAWMKGLSTFVVAAVTLFVLFWLAWRSGRTHCNTICPIGTILGSFARYSLFRPMFDVEKCKNCSPCSRRCETSCIDYKNYSRCVACMDCVHTFVKAQEKKVDGGLAVIETLLYRIDTKEFQ